MTAMQALNAFWNSFGLLAFDENTVPEYITNEHGDKIKLEPPYITYEAREDYFDNTMALSASIWYRSSSWADITAKEEQIAEFIGRGGRMVAFTGGAFWIKRGTPWAQRMGDTSDDMIRRIVLNIELEIIQ